MRASLPVVLVLPLGAQPLPPSSLPRPSGPVRIDPTATPGLTVVFDR